SPGGLWSVAVRRPVPGLARQVAEAVAAGVGLEPAESGAAAGEYGSALREVDGKAALVVGSARPGRRRTALRGRLLPDVVIAGTAVRTAQGDLCAGVAVAAAAESDAVGLGGVEQVAQVVGD